MRISEPKLILPALYFINNKPNISTSELIDVLTECLKPSGEDAEILKNRKDTKFSQIVRNLVSHKTIDQNGLGYTEYKREGNNGYHKITDKGKKFLEENLEFLEYLMDNNFSYDNLENGITKLTKSINENRIIETFDENSSILISEGNKIKTTTSKYKHSRKLRDAAFDYYSKGGKIQCEVCSFDFYDFYGDSGKGFIEMHHKNPVFKYEDEDFEIFLKEALKNIAPVCSNCHRIIHRFLKNQLTIEELRKKVEKS